MIWEVIVSFLNPTKKEKPPFPQTYKPRNDNKIEIKKTCCFVYVCVGEIIDFSPPHSEQNHESEWEMKRETDFLPIEKL